MDRERVRQIEGAELIASENYTSEAAAGRKHFDQQVRRGASRKRYYGGCEFVDQVEQLAIDRLCELFGGGPTYNRTRVPLPIPRSRSHAKPGDTILGFDFDGGHLTHGLPSTTAANCTAPPSGGEGARASTWTRWKSRPKKRAPTSSVVLRLRP